ncbi:MAG: hypothetical protein ACKVU0_07740 [Saprospiraceae bacterium]
MDKWFAGGRFWLNVLVWTNLITSLLAAGMSLLFAAEDSFGGSWWNVAQLILGHLLKIFGLVGIWRKSKLGIAMMASGMSILVAFYWPLDWEDQLTQFFLFDLVILIWAVWIFGTNRKE